MVLLIHLIVSAWSSTNKCANEIPNYKSRWIDDGQNLKEKCLHNQKFELSCLNSYEWIWVLPYVVFVENAFGQACNSWICAFKFDFRLCITDRWHLVFCSWVDVNAVG